VNSASDHRKKQPEAAGPDQGHQRPEHQRPGDRAEPVDEKEPPGGCGHVLEGEVVIRVGDQKGIERLRQTAGERADGQKHREDVPQDHADEADDGTGSAAPHDEDAPVHAVRQPADGILEHDRADEEGRDEKRQLAEAQTQFRGIDRAHAELAGEDRAHERHADDAEGRGAVELQQAHRPRRLEGRGGRDRQQDRREAERDEDGRDDEQQKPCRIARGQDPLRADEADHLNQHVSRQRLPARFVGGRVVEPAFGGDVDTREREPEDHAERHPRPGVGQDGKRDQCGRDERAQRREDTHMAHAGDEFRRKAGPAEEAHEIGRGDHRQLDRGEPLDRAPHTHERALKTVADLQEEHAEEEGPGGA
jgi:hypothetical protein